MSWRFRGIATSTVLAVLGAATVAVVAVLSLVGLGVLPKITGAGGTATPSQDASAGATAAVQPTLIATPSQSVDVAWPTVAPSEASVPSSLDGQDFAFWTLDERVPCCGSTLRISTSTGGRESIIDLPALVMAPELWPTPVGPAGGRVLFVMDDGATAQLMVQDTRTGAGANLTSTSHVIARVAMDPRGSTAYFLLFDRRTAAFQGMWAIPTDGGQPRLLTAVHPSHPLTAVQTPTGMATLVAERVYSPQLAVSDDGRWIAFATCQQAVCEFQAIHPDGTSEHSDWSNLHAGDTIVGMTGDLLIGSTECPQATCDGFVLDLRTGERWPLGGADQPFAPAQLIAGPRGPLVLAQSADHDRGLWQVEALDLTDGRRSGAFGATFEPGVADLRLAEGRNSAGAELPPGWFLIYRNADPEAFVQPEFSAATAGAALETKLPFMESPHP